MRDAARVAGEEMRRAIPFPEGSVFQPEELEEGASALKRRLDAEGIRVAVPPTIVPGSDTAG